MLKKIISLFLAASLSLSCLSGCGSKSEKQEDSSAKLLVDGKEVSIPYLAKVGDDEIPYDEFRYYFLNYKSQVEENDPDIWETDENAQKNMIHSAYQQTMANYVIRTSAKEYGVELSETESAAVDSSIQESINNAGSEEDFNKILESQSLTPELYRKVLETQLLSSKLLNYLCENDFKTQYGDSVISEIKSNFIRASHILVEEDQEELAEELTQRARNGEDFNYLVEQYGKDEGMKNNTNGYYFTEGEMVTEFYEAAKALKEGEVSDPVKSEYGYHVIKRLPLEDSYIQENLTELMKKTDTIGDAYRNFLTNKIDSLKVEKHENFDKISVDSVQ
jgi:parvulin-like peptidyl-prolyl isomerase